MRRACYCTTGVIRIPRLVMAMSPRCCPVHEQGPMTTKILGMQGKGRPPCHTLRIAHPACRQPWRRQRPGVSSMIFRQGRKGLWRQAEPESVLILALTAGLDPVREIITGFNRLRAWHQHVLHFV